MYKLATNFNGQKVDYNLQDQRESAFIRVATEIQRPQVFADYLRDCYYGFQGTYGQYKAQWSAQ